MMRELKLKELQAMDATRRKFLQHQQMKREAEIANLDDQIRRKARAAATHFVHTLWGRFHEALAPY